VLVRCPLVEAMRREAMRSLEAAHHGKTRGYVTPGLYAKALGRKRSGVPVPGLGQVVGVDVDFEEDPQAECVLDALLPVPENTATVLGFVRGWLGVA
jgi:adenylylsulfate kinase